jgi:sulfite exporter TauE/SafE
MLLVGSDLFVILIGLGSAGLFAKLNILTLEFSGPISAMSNMVKGLRKLPSALSALPLGLMFGFLPCGMLYAMALTAVQSADQVTGALMMAAYGLGTAPVLFLVGGTAQWISSKRRWMLKAAGVMVALIGSYNLYVHIRMLG